MKYYVKQVTLELDSIEFLNLNVAVNYYINYLLRKGEIPSSDIDKLSKQLNDIRKGLDSESN